MQYIVDYDSKITSQTELLYQQPTEFQSFSDDERRRIVLRFRDQVHRSPLIYVQNYSDKLQSFFEKWIEDWTQKERECRGKITTQLLSLGQLITSTRQALDAPANVTPDPKFPELRLKGPRFPTWPPQDLSPDDLSKSCDFVSLSSTAIPVLEADDRHIGPFDFLYDWLVRSGSRTLTLIVGLVGFGVFGAMFSSYIRGGRASQDVFRDFVRGVASVILTYVLIIGGLTVVTKEASPNPYALFAACFIASVFSKRIFQVAKDNLKI
jgi:hypothetical protein